MVYGRREAVGREGCAIGNETENVRRNDENRRPGDEDDKIGDTAKEGVVIVADLQRLDLTAETSRTAAGSGWGSLKGEGKNFKCQQYQQDCRNFASPFHVAFTIPIS